MKNKDNRFNQKTKKSKPTNSIVAGALGVVGGFYATTFFIFKNYNIVQLF